MDNDVKQNLTAVDTWIRGFFMLLFLIVYSVAEAVWVMVAIFQFAHALITGAPRGNVREFNENLCAFLYETLLYISFGTEQRPWPFASWPDLASEFPDEEVPVHAEADYEPGDEAPVDDSDVQDQEVDPAEPDKG